jgi:hypothetical protein
MPSGALTGTEPALTFSTTANFALCSCDPAGCGSNLKGRRRIERNATEIEEIIDRAI